MENVKLMLERRIFDRAGIVCSDTISGPIRGMVLAIDNKNTATYKLEELIPALQSKKYFEKLDMTSTFYKYLVISWFLGSTNFSNFSWGIYNSEEDTFSPLPLNLRDTFSGDWYNVKYRYKTMTPEPETMITVAKDTCYIESLLETYTAVSDVVESCTKEVTSKYVEQLSAMENCLSFLRYKLRQVDTAVIDGVVNTAEYREFVERINPELHIKLLHNKVEEDLLTNKKLKDSIVKFIGESTKYN